MIKDLVDAIVRAASGADLEALRSACSALIERLPEQRNGIDPAEARCALNGLRKHRRFAFMRRLSQAFLDDGCRDPQVIRHFAQALIERGETIPAIRILENLVADPAIPCAEWAEAKGALGRAWKDRAVRARGIRNDVAREATLASFGHYRDAWVKDERHFFQGVNHVAVAAWDNGLFLSPAALEGARAAAQSIFDLIKRVPEEKREFMGLCVRRRSAARPGQISRSARMVWRVWEAGRQRLRTRRNGAPAQPALARGRP